MYSISVHQSRNIQYYKSDDKYSAINTVEHGQNSYLTYTSMPNNT